MHVWEERGEGGKMTERQLKGGGDQKKGGTRVTVNAFEEEVRKER